MDRIEVDMAFERETKNKVRYKAEDDTCGVDQMYIMKTVLGRPFPAGLRVVIEPVEEAGTKG